MHTFILRFLTRTCAVKYVIITLANVHPALWAHVDSKVTVRWLLPDTFPRKLNYISKLILWTEETRDAFLKQNVFMDFNIQLAHSAHHNNQTDNITHMDMWYQIMKISTNTVRSGKTLNKWVILLFLQWTESLPSFSFNKYFYNYLGNNFIFSKYMKTGLRTEEEEKSQQINPSNEMW